MLKRTAFFLFILLTILSGCTNKPFTMNDNGHIAELDMDTPFEVELEGNASTGYSWQIVEMDTNVIKQTGEPEYERPVDRTGAGGTYTFSFRTVNYGESLLVMAYGRPGEDPVKTFRIKIISGTMGRILGE